MQPTTLSMVILTLVSLPGTSVGDMYASAQRMEILLHLELQFLKYFEPQAQDLPHAATINDNFVTCLQHCSNYTKNAASYFSNPLNGYLFLRRFNADWPQFLKDMFGSDIPSTISDEARSFIDLVHSQEGGEVEGALLALFRLQMMYTVPASELVHGNQIWPPVSVDYTTSTAYNLCESALQLGYVDLAQGWLLEAMDSQTTPVADHTQLNTLLKAIKELKRFRPNSDEEWSKVVNTYLSASPLLSNNNVGRDSMGGIKLDSRDQKTIHPYPDFVATLCAGTSSGETLPLSAQHICRYDRTSPYGILRPVKEEILSYDPWVVLYHDVLTVWQVNTVVDLSKHDLRRAGVSNKGQREICPNRIASSSWLHEDNNEVLKGISFKTNIITGLNLDTAENLQVANYGMGGFYNSHYDAYQDGIPREFGNRIATAMFYLSDVAAGGATVFPELQLAVRPEKGAMLFWYNLFRTGEVDRRMLHTGCPVLSGSKWVANRWLRERGQEFIRPCLTCPSAWHLILYWCQLNILEYVSCNKM